MCFIDNTRAVSIFPEESFIRGRSFINPTGRTITFLPITYHAYIPQTSLVPFREFASAADARSLVLDYFNS
jgi:hypothetical protein